MKVSIGIKSLGIQTSSFLFCSLSLILLNQTFGFTSSPALFLLCCGSVAATISLLLKLDWWWVPIQLCFPSVIYLAYQLNIPPLVYLVALLICALIFWSTYRTQVPYYPSRSTLAVPIVTLLDEFEHPSLIDLGSGLGGLLFRIEDMRKSVKLFGIEIAPLPYCYSQCRCLYRRSNVKFLFGSYFALDLSEFDVVFCYLSPAAMPDLWDKASAEMKKGSVLLSYEFIIPDVPPSFIIETEDDGPVLYGWRI